MMRGGEVHPGLPGILPPGSWIEFIGWHPRSWLLHNFISDEECEAIKAYAKPKLQRSQVVDQGKSTDSGRVDDIRTSSGMFIFPKQLPEVDAVLARLSKVVMIPVQNMEAMQVLHYAVGQSYRSHQDTFPKSTLDSAGQRVISAIGFLNTAEEGGETTFSRVPPRPGTQQAPDWSPCGQAGLGVKAKKGDLVFFWDVLPNGNPDINSTHYACPVIKGEKWSTPIWIHANNFQTRHAVKPGPPCQDMQDACPTWAAAGECRRNPSFMVGQDESPGTCVDSCRKVDLDS
eukprot:jgi/Mesvir1/27682/Mv07401-RA.1